MLPSVAAVLTVLAVNAQLTPLYNVPVTLSTSGTGSATLSAESGVTNVEGKFSFSVTGSSSGEVTVTAEGLGDTATQTLTISPAGATFGISSPGTDLFSLRTNDDLAITVTAPDQNQVQFATTLGTLTGSAQTGPVIVEPVSGGTATVTLSSTKAGVATVQIYNYDLDAPPIADSLTVAISAPTGEADSISLQASVTVIAPSSGDVVNTASLNVSVKNSSGQPVGGAPVAFTIVNPIGNETISPVIVYTNNQGTATSTFTSGSLSSTALGVTVRASVVGFVPEITDDINIVIGGAAGSVVIGRGTTVMSINSDTAYLLPMSVLVADANGNPVSGAVVSLNSWPSNYARGHWVKFEDECEAVIESTHTNEDIDKDLSLDPNEDWNGDTELTPPNSAAGSLPDTVTTDQNGLAQFDLVYTKSSAVWIKDEITATVQVSGTETRSTYPFWLPHLALEACNLADSPYNRVGQAISLTPSPSNITADGVSTSLVAAVVTDPEGAAVPDGEIVNFTTTAGDIDGSQPGLQTVFSTTTVGGVATATLIAPTATGSGKVTATYGTTVADASVIFVPGPVSAIDLNASPNNLNADGSSTSAITATVTDVSGNIVADGETITFGITSGSGTLSFLEGTTYYGKVMTQYTAGTTTGTVTIAAQSTNATTNTLDITLIAPPIGSVTASAGSRMVVADGASQSLITATVRDVNFNLISDGTIVTFSTTAGDMDNTQNGIQATATATTINGVASVLLTSPTNVGSAAVTATVGGVSGSTAVTFIPAAPNSISLTATPNNMTADGSSASTIRAVVTDAFGNGVADGGTITFSITAGSGTLSSQTAMTIGGVAAVSYYASTDTGTATIAAQATNGASATADISLIGANIGSVTVTRGSASIVADGSSETTISATVRDTAYNAVADGTTVTFTATAGDIDAATPGTQASYAATTINGVALATLTSPTIVGSSTINATAGGVSGGTFVNFIPGAVAAVSLKATPSNLTADNQSTSTIVARVTDANGNDVANGETISFSITAGTGSLNLPTDTTFNGKATVIYTASDTAGTETIAAQSTNGMSDTVDVTLVAAAIGSLSLSSSTSSIYADGTSQSLITAVVHNTAGQNVTDGTVVSFATTAGTLSSDSAATVNGVATVMLTSPTIIGSAVITGTVGGMSASDTVYFLPAAPSSISMTASPNNLTADGNSNSIIRTAVLDANGNAVADGETIVFSVSAGSGTLSRLSATTTNGIATTVYTASDTAGTETVTAKATNNTTATADITLVEPAIGSVQLAAGSANIVAGDAIPTSITVTVRDVLGEFVADGTAVTLTTTAGTLGNAAPTTTNGVASTTLTSPTLVGAVTIRATVGGISNTVTVDVVPDAVDDIILSATPSNLTADGASISTVRARVLDANDNAVANGETITFSITAGSGILSSSTAATVNGVAAVTYTASDTAGTETITARATNNTSETVDITLVASAVGSVDIAAGSGNIVAGSATPTSITVAVRDASGNFVADGTAVTLTTTAGTLGNAAATTTNGVASTTLTSPALVGTATVRATVGGISNTVLITIVPGAVDDIVLSATPANLAADGASTSTVRATVLDVNDNAVADGETIAFSITAGTGTLSNLTATTINGVATVTYTASNTAGTETVTAKATNNTSETVDIALVASAVGSVDIAAGSDNIVAGSATPTSISVTVRDASGNFVADGTVVTLTTTAGTLGNAAPTTTNGVASTTLTSPSLVGTATVRATVGGISNTVSVAIVPGAVDDIVLSATPSNLSADGASTSTIQATVLDANDNAVADGETITFSITAGTGTLSSSTATTINGVAAVTYTASDTAGTETVTAKATNNTSETVDITLVASAVGSVDIAAGSDNIVAGSATPTSISVTVRDASGNFVADGTVVTLTTTAGTLGNAAPTTTNGVASTTLTSPALVGIAAVRATVGGISDTVSVTIVPGSVDDIVLSATPANLAADGASTSTIQATVLDANDNAVADGEIITFSITAGTGTLSSLTATAINGVAAVTYTASDTAGTETVTAKATNSTSETVDITLVASAVGSVDIAAGSDNMVAGSATPTSISVTVRDASENFVADGTAVTLTTTAGTLGNAAPTTTNGVASTTLTSPTLVGIATVRATVGGISNTVSVTIVPGAVDDIVLSATPSNLSADGASTSTIQATVLDTNDNAVADGEAIVFSVSAGTGTLSQLSATTTNGIAAVTYTASDTAGTETVTAKATNSTTETVDITLVASAVASVDIAAGSDTIVAGSATPTSITVTVRDASGNFVADGTAVTLTTTAGTLGNAAPTTTNGVASTTLTSPALVGIATVRATVGGVSDSVSVTIIPGAVDDIVLSATPSNLTADGASTSTIQATVLDVNDNTVANGETITFSVTAGTGTLSNLTAATTNGVAVVTYTSSGTAGTETVTAKATNNTTETVDIVLIAASVGSVSVTTSSSSIQADGASTALITAVVEDTSGNDVSDGTAVTFTTTAGDIDSATGGTQTTVSTTTTNGAATATLTSSTTAGAVTVTATAGGVSDTVDMTFTQVPTYLSLSLSQVSVKSDNSDSATVYATLLDSNYAVIEGETVSFTATGGQISSTTSVTDANGRASIAFSSGTYDPTNQTVQVSASVTGLAAVQIPVQVTGSVLSLSTDNTTIPDDGSSTATLTVLAKDAGDVPVYNATINFSVSGSGNATVTPNSDTTDVSGELSVVITGTGAGSVTITASSLGTTSTQDYTVSAVGSVFGITAPAADPASLDVGDTLTVTVNAPAGVTDVRFATTLGTWTESGSSIYTNTAGPGALSATLTSTVAGLATVQVFDADDSGTSDTITVAVSSPATDAAQLVLQANASVVAASSGDVENSTTLVATVRTSSASGSQAVGDAPVAFAILDPTGGGEKISPVIAYTDSSGVAETTFTSGSASSGAEGVEIKAWVVGEGTTGSQTDIAFVDSNPDTITWVAGSFTPDFEVGEQVLVEGSASNDGLYTINGVAANTLTLIANDALTVEGAGESVTVTAIANTTQIVIGGTAGSVVIGRGAQITNVNSTTYALPMSVLVADSNGNPVSGAVVSLSIWPSQYTTGVWYDENPDADDESYLTYKAGTFSNEDVNENLFLDAGEDTNQDGEITPPNSAAGAVPDSVTTDASGVANFNLTYLKGSAVWIVNRIRASTIVLGTETSSSTTFRLPYLESEAGELPDSPYTTTVKVSSGGGNHAGIYDFPVFRDSVNDEFTSTDTNSSIVLATGVYDFNPDAPTAYTAGEVVTDYVSIKGDAIDPDTGADGSVYATVPIDIVVE